MGFPSRLDKYVFYLALSPFLAGTFSALGLYLVVDLFSSLGKLSSALSNGAEISQLVRFFVLKIPSIFVMSFPLVFCLSITIAVFGIVKRGEYLCCLASGISIRKALLAVFGAAVIFCSLYFICSDIFVPGVSSVQTQLRADLFNKESSLSTVLPEEITEDSKVSFHIEKLFRTKEGLAAKGFNCYVSSPNETSEIHASNATWSRETKIWTLTNGRKFIHFEDRSRKVIDIESFQSDLSEANYLHHLPPNSFSIKDLWILRSTQSFKYELLSRILSPIALLFLCLILSVKKVWQ